MLPARVLKLTKGFVAIVSSCDYARVSKHSWHVHMSRGTKKKPGQPYARATIKGKKVYLHRFLMDCPEGMEPDHKNHQTLDCRRENLVITDRTTNNRNRRGNYGQVKKTQDTASLQA